MSLLDLPAEIRLNIYQCMTSPHGRQIHYKGLYLTCHQIKNELHDELIKTMLEVVRESCPCRLSLQTSTAGLPHRQSIEIVTRGKSLKDMKSLREGKCMWIPALDQSTFCTLFSKLVALSLIELTIEFAFHQRESAYDWGLESVCDTLISRIRLQPTEIRCQQIEFIDVGVISEGKFKSYEPRLVGVSEGTWKVERYRLYLGYQPRFGRPREYKNNIVMKMG
ncbi:hypothetical protein K491DRAFT_697846 [Lophiostoma macrostomum CBS 122681]|uniref:F-box domain-containing protein n=1 Tax=Lophiostoma macrostomum CBS 122681 TaxID=1314788 RepID=A0A6A6SQ43_9PLEO|nr:hypothetical protein K491DRAFT_697846 [Lophiostoma macrostomum CBS 122681]